ncbi:MAG TPA: hypothetical protein VGA75_10630 [Paracoccaceae bacterium]
MKKTVLAAALVALALPLSVTPAAAGPIERACISSNRDAANRAVCGCIQQVADQTLRGGDQRKAAKFFSDPERAQEVRMSKRDSDNAFWARYKSFGELAEAYCAG